MKKLIFTLSLLYLSLPIFAMDCNNVTKKYGDPSLHDAVFENDPAYVRDLLAAGVSVTHRNQSGRTALESARCQAASQRKLLDSKKGDPFFSNRMSGYVKEELRKMEDIIALLEKAQAAQDRADTKQDEAETKEAWQDGIASKYRGEDLTRPSSTPEQDLLLRNKGYEGPTLHDAVFENDPAYVRDLLAAGVSVTHRNQSGRTALESARCQAASRRKLLDSKKGDPFFSNRMSDYVKEELRKMEDIIALLEKAQVAQGEVETKEDWQDGIASKYRVADVGGPSSTPEQDLLHCSKGYEGATLHDAVLANDPAYVRDLLAAEASLMYCNQEGHTPLESARRQADTRRALLDDAKKNDPLFYKRMGHVEDELSKLRDIIALLEKAQAAQDRVEAKQGEVETKEDWQDGIAFKYRVADVGGPIRRRKHPEANFELRTQEALSVSQKPVVTLKGLEQQLRYPVNRTDFPAEEVVSHVTRHETADHILFFGIKKDQPCVSIRASLHKDTGSIEVDEWYKGRDKNGNMDRHAMPSPYSERSQETYAALQALHEKQQRGAREYGENEKKEERVVRDILKDESEEPESEELDAGLAQSDLIDQQPVQASKKKCAQWMCNIL